MSIDTLISRLDGVKETGNGKYLACCPAHDDRSPSLAITDDEGRVLLHCFAGCDPESVLDAIGLKFSDLYPEPLGHHFKSSPMRVSPREILETLDHPGIPGRPGGEGGDQQGAGRDDLHPRVVPGGRPARLPAGEDTGHYRRADTRGT